SPSTVHGFARLWAVHGREGAPFVVACIGPVTAAAARESGFPVHVTAAAYTVPGLVAALAAYRQKGAGSEGVSGATPAATAGDQRPAPAGAGAQVGPFGFRLSSVCRPGQGPDGTGGGHARRGEALA